MTMSGIDLSFFFSSSDLGYGLGYKGSLQGLGLPSGEGEGHHIVKALGLADLAQHANDVQSPQRHYCRLAGPWPCKGRRLPQDLGGLGSGGGGGDGGGGGRAFGTEVWTSLDTHMQMVLYGRG